MTTTSIITLGALRLDQDQLRNQHLPLVLLAYLAHEGRRERQHVAQLFWPTAKNPLNNLSSALSRIRQEVPQALTVEPHHISTPWQTDARLVVTLIESGRVEDGINLYRGPFLDGFRLRSLGIELEEWIYETRQRIAATVAQAAIDRSRSLLAAGQWTAAVDLADKVVGIDVMSPVVLDNADYLYATLLGADRLSAQTLRSEAESVGVSLSDVEPTRPVEEFSHIPIRDRFIGRESELARLHELAKPGNVVNVYGLGGSGKSTLAGRFATSMATTTEYDWQVHEVRLDAESNAERLDDAIRTALLPQAASKDTLEISEMVGAPTMLIIDDVSPSPEVASFLNGLHGVDGFCCIATSRMRIESPTVHGLGMRGLSGPNEQGRSHAAALFVQSAGAAFAIDEPGQPISQLVEKICERVSGLPLAVELTAAWLRMVPLAEILPLFDDDDMLDQPPPGQNLSLGLVISRSWDMLDEDSQAALSNLSIMHGGFLRSAAREVAGVGMGALTKLHDYSLIDVADSGRITLHPLIRDFALKQLRLDESAHAAMVESHRAYFASLLNDAVSNGSGLDQGRALQQVRDDHQNVEAAWHALIDAGDWNTVSRTVDSLDTYLLRSGQLIDARRLFQAARDAFRDQGGPSQSDPSLFARLTNNLAWLEMLAGRDAVATALCEEGLGAAPADDYKTRIALLRTRSGILGNVGNTRRALDGYLVAQELAVQLGEEYTLALLHEDIGRCYQLLGAYDDATVVFRKTLDSARALGDKHMEARSYLTLARNLIDADPQHALVLLDEGSALAEAHGFDHLHAYFPKERAFAYAAMRDFQRAAEEFRGGVTMADQVGDRHIRLTNVAGLARMLLQQDDLATARGSIEEACRLAIASDGWPPVLGLGMTVAKHAASVGVEPDLAAQLFHFCKEHPQVFYEDLVREAGDELSLPEKPLPAGARLDETCERILRLTRAMTER